jgi:hypothetical protein
MTYSIYLYIFEPKGDEITMEWRKLHNEDLNDLFSSPNIVPVTKPRRMRWTRHVARMGESTGVYRVLVGKPEGKRPLGRPRRRWEDGWMFRKWDVEVWTGSSWLRIRKGGRHL